MLFLSAPGTVVPTGPTPPGRPGPPESAAAPSGKPGPQGIPMLHLEKAPYLYPQGPLLIET